MAMVVAMNTGIFAVFMVHKLLWTYSLKKSITYYQGETATPEFSSPRVVSNDD
jgi:hypothetical protein